MSRFRPTVTAALAAGATLAVLATLAVPSAAAPAAAAHPAGGTWSATPSEGDVFDVIALGDSYASGEGSTDFNALPEATECHRSPNSLSAVATTAVDPAWTRLDATCSGAVVGNLSAPQAADGAPGGSVAPQLDALAALDPNGARFVTVSIGGNDAGFADVLASCVLGGMFGGGGDGSDGGDSCQGRNPEVEPFLADGFGNTLAVAYDALAERLSTVAGGWAGADTTRPIVVFVTDYPLIFPADPGAGCEQIPAGDLDWLNEMWRTANATIAAEVAAADARAATAAAAVPVRFQLVPLGDALDGHRLCEAPPAEPSTAGDNSTEWVNGLELGNLFNGEERAYAFHPNAAGHAAMAARLAEAMRNPPTADSAPVAPPVAGGDDSDRTVLFVAIGVAALAAAGAIAFVVARRRR